MADRSDEGGDPACWAHLFEEEDRGAHGPVPAWRERRALPPTRVWVIRGGERNRLVDEFVADSVIGVGYASVPDARTITDVELEHLSPVHARMFRSFAEEMSPGDVVLMPDTPRRELLVGRITGPYEFEPALPADRYRHRRTVDWLDGIPFDGLPPVASNLHRQQQTLTERTDPAFLDLVPE